MYYINAYISNTYTNNTNHTTYCSRLSTAAVSRCVDKNNTCRAPHERGGARLRARLDDLAQPGDANIIYIYIYIYSMCVYIYIYMLYIAIMYVISIP